MKLRRAPIVNEPINVLGLFQLSVLASAGFGIMLLIRKRPVRPGIRVHPTRLTEAFAPYGFGISLLGMLITGVILLLQGLR